MITGTKQYIEIKKNKKKQKKKKKKNESNLHEMLHTDQSFKCEYSSSNFNFIISF